MRRIKKFMLAMVRWAFGGFPVVMRRCYWRRVLVCMRCSKLAHKCICGECGCFVFAKAALATEDCDWWVRDD